MEFLKVKVFPKLLVKLVFISLIVILYLSVPFSIANAAPVPVDPTRDTYTYAACYFQKGDNKTWQWGLKGDDGWYKLNGKWVVTADTKITRFETSTNRNDIVGSCLNSQRYYNKGDYSIVGIYAADSSAGYNYPIYANGQEVTP
jgi:hypothetical protein